MSDQPVVVIIAGAGMSAENKDVYSGYFVGDYASKCGVAIAGGKTYREIVNYDSYLCDTEIFQKFVRDHARSLCHADLHPGYESLREMCEGYTTVVLTTNVDGAFHRAGFEHVWEIHGSLNAVQCNGTGAKCRQAKHDENWFLRGKKACDHCGTPLRPNILLFNDDLWKDSIYAAQYENIVRILKSVGKDVPVTFLEIGCGYEIDEAIRVGIDMRKLLQPYKRQMYYRVTIDEFDPKPRPWKTLVICPAQELHLLESEGIFPPV